MKILVAGQGPMAREQIKLCSERKINCTHICEPIDLKSENVPKISSDTVIIHFGTGRLIPYLDELSSRAKIPMIQGSSYELAIDEMVKCNGSHIVHAPNLCLPIASTIDLIAEMVVKWKKFTKLEIVESHQKKKQDVSKTAKVIAKKAGIDESDIVSFRKEIEQLIFGVPPEFIDGHAYHHFIATADGVKLKLCTEVHGRRTYADGAMKVGQALLDNPNLVDYGITPLTDIIDQLV
jgi:dihydrodipicolinate reductase